VAASRHRRSLYRISTAHNSSGLKRLFLRAFPPYPGIIEHSTRVKHDEKDDWSHKDEAFFATKVMMFGKTRARLTLLFTSLRYSRTLAGSK
jgi:hypothetical protein